MTTMIKLFVYGTLKEGFVNHNRFLKDCKKVKDAEIYGLMFSCGDYPAVVGEGPLADKSAAFATAQSVATDFTVKGEIWEIPQSRLKDLDWLEGCPNLYHRCDRWTLSEDKVLVYIYSRPTTNLKYISDGIWK